MTEDLAYAPLTEAEQAYYNQLDEDVTAGRVPAIGRGTRRDGSRVSDTELDAVLRGRPGLGQSRATGRVGVLGQADLAAYVEKHGTTASAVIRDAVEAYLATA
ncbi:MAG: hypothetical protein ACFN3I_14955 [Arachnia propionica]